MTLKIKADLEAHPLSPTYAASNVSSFLLRHRKAGGVGVWTAGIPGRGRGAAAELTANFDFWTILWEGSGERISLRQVPGSTRLPRMGPVPLTWARAAAPLPCPQRRPPPSALRRAPTAPPPRPRPAPAPPPGDWACSVAVRVAVPGKPPRALRGRLSVASPPPAARAPPGGLRSPRPRFRARPRPARACPQPVRQPRPPGAAAARGDGRSAWSAAAEGGDGDPAAARSDLLSVPQPPPPPPGARRMTPLTPGELWNGTTNRVCHLETSFGQASRHRSACLRCVRVVPVA
uniref:sterile alpha motif domain-containing protein 1-like n=1 Tax=Panthera onca TaxID=9690 RepID=UPI00295388F6|nr:sterile alpha motif domain-containing protein 1-like [Panthera onca]